ncbi:MAG TPA: SBBP repeat-containing protein [Candidatus Limnocylindria bacterium]|nr:SBBP repeat-containing protein [Candidatus Limnocylindria bacterium]
MNTSTRIPQPARRFLSPLLLALVLGSGTALAVSQPLQSVPGTANGIEQPVAVAIDTSAGAANGGAMIVTGISHVLGQASNFVTAKYADGKQLWIRSYNGPASSFDQPRAMTVDADGNIYVTGTSHGTNGNDYATVKYSPAGAELWTARYDAEVDDVPTAICVGADGAIYVTGYSNREGFEAEGITTVKYSATGTQLAVLPLPEPEAEAFDAEGPAAISVDQAGNILLAGASAELREFYDLLVVRLDAAGRVTGQSRVSGPRNFQIFPKSLAPAADGSFAVLSSGELEATGEADLFVTRFDAAGVSQWTGRVGPKVSAAQVRFDGLGNVIVIGTADEKDLLTLKFNPAGTLLSRNEEPLGNALAFGPGAKADVIISATVQPAAAGIANLATFATSLDTSDSLPRITVPPVGFSLVPGTDQALAVGAQNAASYQWYRDGMPIVGAVQATYLPGGVAGDYTVEVANTFGMVLSPLARVSADDVIYDFVFLADGTFQGVFSGELSRVYELQSSDDLSLWNTFFTQRYAGTPWPITDRPAGGSAHRYYRARRFL